MIELIFALVIMGIVLMSAPMLIQQSIKSGNVALQQEAIAAAASHTSMILSLHWDENNTEYQPGMSPILATQTNLGTPFAGNDGMNIPLANINGWLRANRRGLIHRVHAFDPDTLVMGRNTMVTGDILIGASPPTTLKDDGDDNILDDVDDYNNREVQLTVFNGENTTADVGDYVDVNLKINTTVNYGVDTINLTQNTNVSNQFSTNAGQSTNIKFINVKLTSDSGANELNKSITMQAFSCNIGTTAPMDRGEL